MSGTITRKPWPSQERDLVAPQVARVRPAVDEQHRGPAPVLLHVQADLADRDLPAHRSRASRQRRYPCWPGGWYACVALLARASVSLSCVLVEQLVGLQVLEGARAA